MNTITTTTPTPTTTISSRHIGMRTNAYADLAMLVDGYVSAYKQTEAAFMADGFSSHWKECNEIENRWKQWIREEEAKLGL